MGINRRKSLMFFGIFLVIVLGAILLTFGFPTPPQKQPFVNYGDLDFTLTYPILLNVAVKNNESTHYTIDTPGGLCIVPGIYDTKEIPKNRIIPIQLDSGFRLYYWVLQDDGNYRLIEMEGHQ